MSRVVLDASAILALLIGEAGATVVKACLPDALASTVNIAEVATKLSDLGMQDIDIRAVIATLGLEIVMFDEEAAYAVGLLRGHTRSLGLSLGDRACLALAQRKSLAAVTADRSWAKLAIGIEVTVIRG